MKAINISKHSCSEHELKELAKYLKKNSISLTLNDEPVGDGDNDADDGNTGIPPDPTHPGPDGDD